MLDPEKVAALRAEGHSFRAIALALGASLGAVQRADKRAEPVAADAYLSEPDDDEDDLTPDELALFDAEPAAELVAPLVYVGCERVVTPEDHDHGRQVDYVPRFLDAAGQSFGALALYQWWMGDDMGLDPVRTRIFHELTTAPERDGYREITRPHDASRWQWWPVGLAAPAPS